MLDYKNILSLLIKNFKSFLLKLIMITNDALKQEEKDHLILIQESTKLLKALQENGLNALKSDYSLIRLVLSDNITVIDKLYLRLNKSLLKSISETYKQAKSENQEKKNTKTIVGLMLVEKFKKTTITQSLFCLSLILSVAIDHLLHIQTTPWVLCIVILEYIAIYIDQKLIEFRIKNGWYGSNEFETNEILRFIISHSNKDDFNDGNGLKKIIPDPETVFENLRSSPSAGVVA